MSTGTGGVSRSWWVGWVVVSVWLLSYVGARMALDREFGLRPDGLRVAVALLPVLPTIAFLAAIVSGLRSRDELHRRVQLEALAVAYPLAILLLMTLGLIELAVGLSPEDWSYRQVWAFLPLFYVIGLALAWRRYR